MSDDIVTRLRIESASSVDVIRRLDMKCLCCPCCEESCLYCETVGELNEAADEIERWRHIAKELYTWLQPSPEDDSVYEAGVEAMTMYCEAVRDE